MALGILVQDMKKKYPLDLFDGIFSMSEPKEKALFSLIPECTVGLFPLCPSSAHCL
jgi:hypothetical protein